MTGTSTDLRHRLMLATDIEGSSDHRRDESLASELVDTLESLLTASLHDAKIPESAYTYQNRGDGGRFDFADADVSPVQVIRAVTDKVSARLRSHNKRASLSLQLAVRFALHQGYVVPRAYSSDHNGREVEHVHGILDSAEVRETLKGREWVLAVSKDVWKVIEKGHGDFDSTAFVEVQAQVKRHGDTLVRVVRGSARRNDRVERTTAASPGTEGDMHQGSTAPSPVPGIVFSGPATITGSNISGGNQNIQGHDA